MPTAEPTRHIRTTDANVTDHRYRSTSRYGNKLRPVLCGGEPTPRDRSRADALHLIRHEALKPEWTADLCPACRAAVVAGTPEKDLADAHVEVKRLRAEMERLRAERDDARAFSQDWKRQVQVIEKSLAATPENTKALGKALKANLAGLFSSDWTWDDVGRVALAALCARAGIE